jgi:5-methylcytosine-specific restriction enzyme A
MPRRLPGACSHPGCPKLGARGWCDDHRPAARSWTDRAHEPPRLRGRRLQRQRALLFEAQPECVRCLAAGRHTIATIRDHIVALALGGADTPENTQPLCWDCNEAKRIEEAQWGRTTKS